MYIYHTYVEIGKNLIDPKKKLSPRRNTVQDLFNSKIGNSILTTAGFLHDSSYLFGNKKLDIEIYYVLKKNAQNLQFSFKTVKFDLQFM